MAILICYSKNFKIKNIIRQDPISGNAVIEINNYLEI